MCSNGFLYFVIVFCFQYEILCCVQDDQDPAINLVNKMKEKYPSVDCKLFIGE